MSAASLLGFHALHAVEQVILSPTYHALFHLVDVAPAEVRGPSDPVILKAPRIRGTAVSPVETTLRCWNSRRLANARTSDVYSHIFEGDLGFGHFSFLLCISLRPH